MLAEPKQVPLRDGRTALVQTAEVSQAAALLHCVRTCFGETEFLSRYPEEFTITEAQEADWIENARTSPDTALLVCMADGVLLGNAQIDFSPLQKTRHRAVVALSVLRAYWHLGVGTALFAELMALARRRGVEIVELSYIEGNDRARRLYERFGFSAVCEKPFAYRLKDGTDLKEITMQCRL